MVQEIELPDGTIAEFPDGMDDAAIEAVLAKELSSATPTRAPAPRQSQNLAQDITGIYVDDQTGQQYSGIEGSLIEFDRMVRGGASDAVRNVGNFALDVGDTLLDNSLYSIPEAVGDKENYDKQLATMRQGVEFLAGGEQVPEPQGFLNQMGREVITIAPAATTATASLARSVPQLASRGRAALGGAIGDFTSSTPEDPNLGNLIEDQTGVPVPTAKREGDSVWVRRLKDVAEGGILGGAVDAITDIGGAFLKARGKKPVNGKAFSVDDIDDELVEELVVNPDTRQLLEANGVFDPADPGYKEMAAKAEARLLARREAEAARSDTPLGINRDNVDPGYNPQNPNPNQQRFQAEREAAETGYIQTDEGLAPFDPAARATAGGTPRPRPEETAIPVTRDGGAILDDNLGVRRGIDNQRGAEDAARAETQRAFDQADIQRRRAPEYEARRAEAETTARAAGQDPQYESLARRYDEDPAVLAERELGIPQNQFRALPDEARIRVADAAVRQRSAQAPGQGTYRTSDDALSQGQAQYNPSTRPTARVNEVDNPAAQQPLGRELDESGQPYARVASGTSDRPFRETSENLTPEQNRQFENTQRQRFEEARAASVEDLERRWRERANARGSDGKSANFDAEQAYRPGSGARFSNTPKKPAADGRYEVDDFDFVKSDKGGPVKYGDQKQAARWIVNEGHKKSPDQIFEIENHPSGSGFTVRQRGLSEGPDVTNTADDAAGARGGDTPQQLPAPPERAGPTQGSAGGPQGDAAPRSAGDAQASPDTMSARNSNPAPETDAGATAARSSREVVDDDVIPQSADDFANKQKSGTSLGSTFYSNPLDPKAFNELFAGPTAQFLKRQGAEFMESLDDLRRAFDGPKNPDRKSVAQTIADTGRLIGNSIRSQLKMFEMRYPDVKEIRELNDLLATRPGEDRAVKETFNEVMDRRPVRRLQQVLNIIDGYENNQEFMEALGDILSGRKAAKPGTKVATIAQRVRNVLDEEYKYLTDAGLELGYVKKNYFPRVIEYSRVIADPNGFREQATAVYRKAGLDQKAAAEAAEDWYHRILGVGRSPYAAPDVASNKFMKGRKLPADADKIMKDFYITDPVENLSSYFRQTTQRAEFARRFGETGDKVEAMFEAMIKQGVKPQDIALLRQAFDSATGRMGAGGTDLLSGAASFIQTMGTISLLPRAVVSSLAESMAVGIRSGDARNSLKAFKESWEAAFNLKSQEDKRAFAEAIGVIGHAHQQMILAARFGGGMEKKWQQKLLTNFFNRTGLQGLTEGQRVAATTVGRGFVDRMLKDAQAGTRQKSAKQLLAELGIGEEEIASLSKWVDEGVTMTKLAEDTAEATTYRNAVARFVDESIQNPKAVDRPTLANHPIGRMMYSIMSFQYAFTRNVLMRSARQVGRGLNLSNDLSIGDRARYIGILLPFTTLMMGQMGVSRAREALYNPEAQAEKDELEKVMLDISRSGVTGTLDPLLNALSSLKYERDLSNLAVGANLGFFMQKVGNIAGAWPQAWGGKNNPNTNNAEWSAVRGAYQAFGVPLAHTVLSLAPGSKLMRAGYGTLMAAPAPVGVSAPQTSRNVADFFAGEKDIQRRGNTSTTRRQASGEGNKKRNINFK